MLAHAEHSSFGVGEGAGGREDRGRKRRVLLGRGWWCSSHGWTFLGEEKGSASSLAQQEQVC